MMLRTSQEREAAYSSGPSAPARRLHPQRAPNFSKARFVEADQRDSTTPVAVGINRKAAAYWIPRLRWV